MPNKPPEAGTGAVLAAMGAAAGLAMLPPTSPCVDANQDPKSVRGAAMLCFFLTAQTDRLQNG